MIGFENNLHNIVYVKKYDKLVLLKLFELYDTYFIYLVLIFK